MFKEILRNCSSFLLSFFIISSFLFPSFKPVEAAQMSMDNTEENSLGIVIEETGDNTDGAEIGLSPDLGDDQAFPFIPGFGKNSGKD